MLTITTINSAFSCFVKIRLRKAFVETKSAFSSPFFAKISFKKTFAFTLTKASRNKASEIMCCLLSLYLIFRLKRCR